MQLLISNITNLTDARYFNAIGANYLGFSVDVLNENNLPLAKIKEIISWLFEPNILLEIGNHQTVDEIIFLQNEIDFKTIKVNFNHPEIDLLKTNFDVIINTNLSEDITINSVINATKLSQDELLENSILADFLKEENTFLNYNFTTQNILPILKKLHPKGIQITCSKEEKSGCSNVDIYTDILEQIGF